MHDALKKMSLKKIEEEEDRRKNKERGPTLERRKEVLDTLRLLHLIFTLIVSNH